MTTASGMLTNARATKYRNCTRATKKMMAVTSISSAAVEKSFCK